MKMSPITLYWIIGSIISVVWIVFNLMRMRKRWRIVRRDENETESD